MSYTTATFSRLETNSDGRPTMILTYTGNAGEAPVEYSYVQDLQTMPTADYIRGQAMDRLKLLNNNRNFVIGATPNVGSVLDTTTPLPAPPASTYGLFMAASPAVTPGATPQDVFTLTGSATKRVQILRVGITTVQTTAGLNLWSLVKRSSANTGGTSSTLTAVPADDAYPAATAVVRTYTANPTAGTLLGALWTGRVAAPVVTAAADAQYELVILSGGTAGTPITLTGGGDVLAWNFGGVALPPGLSVTASVWWTEQ